MIEQFLSPGYLAVLLISTAVFAATPGVAQEDVFDQPRSDTWMLSGHAKYQFIHTRIPSDSVLQLINGDGLTDQNLETRLKVSGRRDSWDLNVHAQLTGVHSDSLAGFRELPLLILPAIDLVNDDRRWFNLTHELSNEGKNAAVLRIDRLSIGYSGEKTVLRFGRQALSWGNGLMFTPMDILNPFDPATVDKEYKTGDDMVYAQYLLDNGSDIQGVAVVRRDPLSGDVETGQSSLAGKYHGFLGSNEYDLLVAKHYGDELLGVGASTDFGGAIWRGDLVWTDTDSGNFFSAVTGVSYSGMMSGHNWTGFVEYFFNGFGQPNGDYSVAGLASNTELSKRLARGELFNLGRHYLGASITLELTPLVNFTPNVFINLTDPSALAQLLIAYDWKQDIQLLGALNLPIGPGGGEYGGIDSTQPGLYVSTGPSLFMQLGWYF